MSKRGYKIPSPNFKLLLPLYAVLAVIFAILISRGNMQLLQPAGYIAEIQSKLLWGIIIFGGIMATLIISAFFYMVFHYREGKPARFEPNWVASKTMQIFWWGIPAIGIAIISSIVWQTAHAVDPYQPIAGTRPVNIQVVALQWKWLFIYPDDNIATVNKLVIPVNTPISFRLTADAPMNSFWIPRLSGQVYAMTGMVTQLHIRADKLGTFTGSAAEISGDEFAGMNFTVQSVSDNDYASWKTEAMARSQIFDYAAYRQLAKPSGDTSPAEYRLTQPNLFDVIVMQFMEPGIDTSTLQVRGEKY